jgi:hypothetical protein
MKLELKHLAGYLPYGLKIQNGWGDIKTLKYSHLDDENNGFITNVMPILRPLSDLIKEIEEDFNVYSLLSLRSKNDYSNGNPLILKWSYTDIETLFKYHFDIYGLIEAGLAIDINTLN